MDRRTVRSFRRICFSVLAALAAAAVFFLLSYGYSFLSGTLTDRESEAVSAVTADPGLVIPGGRFVGVKLDVEDVLVVGLEEIETEEGKKVNPGLKAGLQIGDVILAIDGNEVHSASDVTAIVDSTQNKSIRLKIGRKNEIRYLDAQPVKSASDGKYRLGVWVKEKTAGIGTLTYYRPYDGTFGALGHGITDAETGSILKVAEGQLLDAQVMSLKEGKKGDPGEIRGIFYEADQPLGELLKNTEYGIFGTAYTDLSSGEYADPVHTAEPGEVKKGKAWILTTVEKDKVEKFEIKIEKINDDDPESVKNMVICVTDEELIDKSGGIVQGMSGSPILQNGKLVGAVTHVFVNDPKKGYGIFIENMLRNAQ